MALSHPVTHQDVADRLGRPLTDAERIRAALDVDDTYALAEAYGLLSDTPTLGQLVTIVRVALRAFRNPEGVQSETLGNRSVTYAQGGRPGVFFTVDDMRAMRGQTRSSVYSVALTTPADHR